MLTIVNNGSNSDPSQATEQALEALKAHDQNTVVVITKTVIKNANSVYNVYSTLGYLDAGKIIDS